MISIRLNARRGGDRLRRRRGNAPEASAPQGGNCCPAVRRLVLRVIPHGALERVAREDDLVFQAGVEEPFGERLHEAAKCHDFKGLRVAAEEGDVEMAE